MEVIKLMLKGRVEGKVFRIIRIYLATSERKQKLNLRFTLPFYRAPQHHTEQRRMMAHNTYHKIRL